MSRDKKEHPSDKDGLAKNIEKLHAEADKMIDAVKGSGKSHDPVMNAATEAARASAYGFAHLTVAVIAGLIIVIAVMALT